MVRALGAIASSLAELRALPAQLQTLIDRLDLRCAELAHAFADTRTVIYLGRGINYPSPWKVPSSSRRSVTSMPRAIPPGDEARPDRLLDADVPVVSVAMPGPVFDKVLSNAQEAKARDARLIGVAPECPDTEIFDELLPVPAVDELLSPLLT